MAEQKTREEPKAPPAPPRAAPAPLGAAGESGDPAVHQLLAQRDIAERNSDQDAVKAATKALAELGVE